MLRLVLFSDSQIEASKKPASSLSGLVIHPNDIRPEIYHVSRLVLPFISLPLIMMTSRRNWQMETEDCHEMQVDPAFFVKFDSGDIHLIVKSYIHCYRTHPMAKQGI